MLREGWDVQSVTVVVGLRPYTAKANILPEQTIGRGLRLMFWGTGVPYAERSSRTAFTKRLPGAYSPSGDHESGGCDG